MRDHGLIANASDYDELPLPLIEDARLWMAAEATEARRAAQGGAHGGHR